MISVRERENAMLCYILQEGNLGEMSLYSCPYQLSISRILWHIVILQMYASPIYCGMNGMRAVT